MQEKNAIVRETIDRLEAVIKSQLELQISSLVSKLNETNGNDGKFCYRFTDEEISLYKTDDNHGKLKLITEVSYYDVSDLLEILSLLNIQPVERSQRGSTDSVILDDGCSLNIGSTCPTTHKTL